MSKQPQSVSPPEPGRQFSFDWADLAFASKKPLNLLRATFVVAPRELSQARLKQLLKTYLPQGNVIIGFAREPYITGFEGQTQFRTLRPEAIEPIQKLVNSRITRGSTSGAALYTLRYAQADLEYILEKCDFRRVMLVNGSWHQSFHTTKPFYVLARRQTEYELVSPFADEAEAVAYEQAAAPQIAAATPLPATGTMLTGQGMLQAAAAAARYSYDYSFQTGAALGKRKDQTGKRRKPDGTTPGETYQLLATAYNRVVPYQTYAMHHGASREIHFSPPHDLNHYDTVHAEVELILAAARGRIPLEETSVFINLMPCPTCARMLADSPIQECIYSIDHSAGYAVALLEKAGKTVRRLIPDRA